jgi:hypothetical protein
MEVVSFAQAFILAVEQSFKLLLHITGSAVLLCGFECVYCRPVKSSECIDEPRWGAGKIESIGVPHE